MQLIDPDGNPTRLLPGDILYVPWNPRTGTGIVSVERRLTALSFDPPLIAAVNFTEQVAAELHGMQILAFCGLSEIKREVRNECCSFRVGPPNDGHPTRLLPGDILYVPWNQRTGSGIVSVERRLTALSFDPPLIATVNFTEAEAAKLHAQKILALCGLTRTSYERLTEGWAFQIGPPTVQ